MSRDAVLARLALARGFAMRAGTQLDQIIELFLFPEDDPRGDERIDLIEDTLEDVGRLSRVLEKVQALFEDVDPSAPLEEMLDDEEEKETEHAHAPERNRRRVSADE